MLLTDRAARHRAFTLTELAIVLGVIGLILGAIWTAAAKVYTNNKVTKATQEILSVANSLRSTYAGKGVVALASTDLTQFGVNAGWYPTDMLTPAACVSGVNGYDSANPCPLGPWGIELMVGGFTGWGAVHPGPTCLK